MGTTNTTRDDQARRAAWAYTRAADTVSDRHAQIGAAERALAEARRRLAVAEQELLAAQWAAEEQTRTTG